MVLVEASDVLDFSLFLLKCLFVVVIVVVIPPPPPPLQESYSFTLKILF